MLLMLLACGRIGYELHRPNDGGTTPDTGARDASDDGGLDAGTDARADGSSDAGTDAASDAGMPMVLGHVQLGSGGNDFCRAVAANSSGDHAVTGQAESGVDFGSGPVAGDEGYFVASYRANGSLNWGQLDGGTSADDEGRGIDLTEAGEVIAVGSFRPSFDPGNTSAPLAAFGNWDAFALAYPSPGGVPGSRSSGGGTLLDEFTGVAFSPAASNFGFAAIGKIRSAANFDGLPVSATGRHDGVLVVYDGTTTTLGQATARQATVYTSSVDVFLTDIASHPSGGYYIVGSFTGTAASWPTMPVADGDDGFLMRVTQSGSIQWVVPLTGVNAQNLSWVAVGSAGEAYVLGTTRRFSGTIGSEPLPNSSMFGVVVARVEDTGAVSWAHSLSGSMSDAPIGLDVDVDGNPILGVLSPTGFTWGPTAVSNGATVARVDPTTGLPTWVFTGGTEGGQGLAAAGRDAVLFHNFTGSTTVSGLVVNSRGLSDCVLVRIGQR